MTALPTFIERSQNCTYVVFDGIILSLEHLLRAVQLVEEFQIVPLPDIVLPCSSVEINDAAASMIHVGVSNKDSMVFRDADF